MIIYVFKKHENFSKTNKIFDFFNLKRKMLRAGARAGTFDKLEPEPHKTGPALQHC
jgi:hypothetical protein